MGPHPPHPLPRPAHSPAGAHPAHPLLRPAHSPPITPIPPPITPILPITQKIVPIAPMSCISDWCFCCCISFWGCLVHAFWVQRFSSLLMKADKSCLVLSTPLFTLGSPDGNMEGERNRPPPRRLRRPSTFRYPSLRGLVLTLAELHVRVLTSFIKLIKLSQTLMKLLPNHIMVW